MKEHDDRTIQALSLVLTTTFMLWVAVFLHTPWWLFGAIPLTLLSGLCLWIWVDHLKHSNQPTELQPRVR